MATVRNLDGRLNGLVTFEWKLLSKTTLLNKRQDGREDEDEDVTS